MKTLLGSLAFSILSLTVFGQHEHHDQPKKDTTKMKTMDHSKMDHKQMAAASMNDDMDSTMMPPMTHAYSLNLPMNRNGSGTGWLPDASSS